MAKAKPNDRKPKMLRRKIFFYRINAGVEKDTGKPRRINFHPALVHLGNMPFSPDGRYLDSSQDDKQLCCWVEGANLPYRLKLANIRRAGHPPVESDGNFSPLQLRTGSGLAEITHIVIFPDDICAAEFNFYSPRATALSFYFAVKLAGICPSFRLNPLIRKDLDQRLASISDLKAFTMKVRASYADTVEEANKDLGAAFKATRDALSARPHDEIEVIFKRKKNKKFEPRSVSGAFLESLKSLVKRKDLAEQVSIFKITGVSGGVVSPLDLLKEQFIIEKEVAPASDGLGGVDSNSMFTAIEEAYSSVRQQLSEASELE